ncbi:MAG: GNAT family N-acetyltransferase [Specibacter sp.]
MKAAPVLTLRASRGHEDIEELTNVWRDSVEATHHFLPVVVIDRLEPVIRDEYLPNLTVHVAELNGCIVAFIGMQERQVAMLFVADEARSLGIGSKLIEWAKNRFSTLTVDVNEQNPRAAVFYIRRGFRPRGRSETDAQGLPFPLLHMSWSVQPQDVSQPFQSMLPSQ